MALGVHGRRARHVLPEKIRVERAWNFYREMGSPRFICAPMVGQSELPFRLMLRKAGCDLCYTPMMHAEEFAGSSEEEMARQGFATCAEDRPLVVQFCAKTPEDFLQAALQVQDRCDAVDLNLGCPQSKAMKGGWGGALMEEDQWHLVYAILRHACTAPELRIPVTCKIRIFADDRKTLRFAKMLEEAGCSFLTVHGRQRDRALHHAPARWEAVRLVRDALKIPVASNGGVSSYDSALRCLEETNCVAVMVATALLQNPELFLPVTEAETEDDASTTCASGSSKPSLAQGVRHCLMYLQICEREPPFSVRWARDHLRALLAGSSKLDLLALLDAVPTDAALSIPQDMSAFAPERKIHWKEICQDFRDVIKTISVHEGLCSEESRHWRPDLPWGTARTRPALKGMGYSLVVEGASAAQQALLRGAPVSKRFAERQKLKALAIKSCFQAASRSERRKTQAT
ncbi:unnamed protein product [Cladocopium goreaui]|uniref:tRNA-dihydrouridine(16/17) synthase [NAD(P)(+)] n=1 Tax=Cladocopium goreaui TaxID=2562237 RepID=A0A9P1DLU1_9DINO|nr:unnamed protein product [Cladocopium goreaui]|mmetsp:Transcript_64812/g.142087  ORF Transcript_64812/g.142087 Transcript_64812/m.142087 type:complete len:459 (+) Transcript_64812:38-1414(+)